MSVDVIRKAFQATEKGFLSLVTKQWPTKPQIAAVGSCCLVGVICGGTLYIANLGDSRAVLGRLVQATEEVLAIQLSTEHNASIESIRQELRSLHPDDSQIVVLKHNVWRVKGLIQIFKKYIEIELQLGNIDRCRKLYEKYLEWAPENCYAWSKYAELERSLSETERARSIFELSIAQPALDMPELLWN